MKNKLVTLLATIGCLCTATFSYGWGTWAHDHINKGAILALPPEMGMFFYNHADFIVTESTSPDIRKHLFSDKAEASRHYIDLERYTTGTGPMPKTLKDAYARWGKDTVETYGSLPWTIEDLMAKLTDAFRKKQKSEILFIAANMGHYIADAHMPLHTTLNHNGQLTGQVGIHPFWEGQLPELFGKDYNLNVGDAHYISNIDKATWNIMDTSFSLVYPLLHTESNMRRDNPEDKQYVMGADGKPLRNVYAQPVHTYEYAHVYHEPAGRNGGATDEVCH